MHPYRIKTVTEILSANTPIRFQRQAASGLPPGISSVAAPPAIAVRATIPAREALREAGCHVRVEPSGICWVEHTLASRMPDGIVAVHINEPPHVALRLDCEPPWPGGHPVWHLQADWLPCPECGARLLWAEAGYVPGYRVCAARPHHHWLVR